MWTGINSGVDKSVYNDESIGPKTTILTQDRGFFVELGGIIVD
jgi:hypothetical protein